MYILELLFILILDKKFPYNTDYNIIIIEYGDGFPINPYLSLYNV